MRAHLVALGRERGDAHARRGCSCCARTASELRPRFRNRLIFPILDQSGNCTGFGGRLLGPGEPKYLNSAESPVYSKGKLLYGLHMAKHAIRREGRVMIVEGYFDVVRLVSAGFEWVVAPLGTALTEDQAAHAPALREAGLSALRQRHGRAQGDLQIRRSAAAAEACRCRW